MLSICYQQLDEERNQNDQAASLVSPTTSHTENHRDIVRILRIVRIGGNQDRC